MLLVGATGVIGGRVVAELARSLNEDDLALVGRDASRLRGRASSLGLPDRNVHIQNDIDAEAIADVAREASVIVSCAGPGYLHEAELARAAIRSSSHYISLNDDAAATRDVGDMGEDARSVGVSLVSGFGFAPGISNALVALAASRLERVDEISVALCASAREDSGPAAALHLADMLDSPASELFDGRIALKEPIAAPVPVFFPPPVGWIETFPVSHPEVETMAGTYDGVRTVQCRFGLNEKVVMDIARLAAASGLLGRGTRELWVKSTAPARPFLAALPPAAPAWAGVRVDVRGKSGDGERTISLGAADKLGNLAGLALARGALQLLEDPPSTGGAIAPERLMPPHELLADLTRRGLRFARLEAAAF